MSSNHSVNFQSLNVVRDELIATIEASARELENFVNSQQEDVDALQASINGVRQICGILKVLELDSAALLAEELLTVSNEIPQGANGAQFNRKLEVISNTFFILPRYLEYLEQVKRQLPVVLVPHINALRRLHSGSPLLESHFSKISVPASLPTASVEQMVISDQDFGREVRRARNMYQMGLAGVIREKHVDRASALMRRGLKRMSRIGGTEASLTQLWHLADTVLDAMVTSNMALLEPRKTLFMRLDRLFRQIELGGRKALSATSPKGLVKELLYLLALSGQQQATGLYSALLSQVRLAYSEQDLQKEYAVLYGPSAHTIASLARVLSTEVGSVKRTLEHAAQNGDGHIDDIESFLGVLGNIAEILSVVGLRQAGLSLKEQIAVVKLWQVDPETLDEKGMDGVANAVLYVESLVEDLEASDFNLRNLDTDPNSRDAQVVSHELASAIQILKEECLGGLSLAKRGLNSFADSNYDTGHIRNIAKTLNTIRGAMALLRKERVTVVLQKSVEFVDEVLMDNDLPAAINEVLETFADVIISVEYFFDSADHFGNMDDSVLKVAEESLAALGFGVDE